MNVPKSALIFTIDQMKVKHHKEMEKMKEMLLKEKEKVKGLEDKFGVTQKRRWGIRQRKWWLIWLSNKDNDAYEYLMKTIHKTLLYGEGCKRERSRRRLIQDRRACLNHVHMSEKKFCDEDVNIYGMKLNSATHWWREGNPIVCQLIGQQTKDYLISCCEENGINFKKSWGKKMFIRLLRKHNHEKTHEKVNPMDLSIEELKGLIERKNEASC